MVRRVTAAHTSPGQAPLGLFTGPTDRVNAVAVVTDEGEFTYSTLARMCAERAAEYPPVTTGRRMIALVATNTLEFLMDYLAAHSRPVCTRLRLGTTCIPTSPCS